MHKKLLLVLTLALFPLSANATSIWVTLAEFNGTQHNIGESYPLPSVPVGTFNFVIPLGEFVVSASIDGTFGNSVVSSSAGNDLDLDGVLVAQCIKPNACYDSGLTAWNFVFPQASLGIFADGSANLSSIQTSETFIRLGETNLHLVTAVPEPSGVLLFSVGMLVVGGALRRRAA